jgi:DNA-binding NarL/FixJ family response regulator
MEEVAQYEPEASENGPAMGHRPAANQVDPPAPKAVAVKNGEMVSERAASFATVLVGSSGLLLGGLARLLDNTHFQVVASAVSVDRLVLSDLSQHQTVLLILDAGRDVETTRRQVQLFKTLHEAGRIAIYGGALRWPDILSFFQAGAHACFPESVATETFLKSLELVMLGETLVPSTLLSSIPSYETPSAPVVDSGSMRLSPQEERILSSLIEGQPNKVIATKLGIADTTVKIHIKNMFRKLRVDNRTQAAAWALSRSSPDSRLDQCPPAPATPADERSSSPVTLPTRDHPPQEPAPAVNGERGVQGLEAPEERSKLYDIDARSERSFVPRSRLLPSERRIVEEQEQREEFLAKMHRLRELRLAREAEERAAGAKSGGENERDSLR